MTRILLLSISFFSLVSASAQIATQQVVDDFNARRAASANPECFSIFDTDLTDQQRQALQVLYAYMPMPDMADYSGEYFLTNADASLRARAEMPWGQTVPDLEFRHFVLPVRVNNENLDAHRWTFYDELKDRVKGLSMEDAILEVNHWCHEKATYQPSDSRTHSPLATVSSAIGRCGEESTFAVAALRSVGIPARQVYTPRWAHTDDNHAWVEAWANGKWHFLGACEPEPVLDLGWFNAPAARGMLMNTRVFGRYTGDEEQLLRIDGYTDINVTDNYAPVDTLRVRVTTRRGHPVKGATVAFCLYNYAEFYPIATKQADKHGMAELTAGLGDLLVWATDGERFGFEKATVGTDSVVTVKLAFETERKPNEPMPLPGIMFVEMDVTPPAPRAAAAQVDPAMTAANEVRKAREDSIRAAYMATFATPAEARALAESLGVDADQMVRIMTDARGNHQTIKQFLESQPANERQRAMALLLSLSQKDRCDVDPEVLREQMLLPTGDGDYYDAYVLCPRVDNEMLTPFVEEFYATFNHDEREAFRADPATWTAWVAKNIALCDNWQPASVKMSPAAVLKGRVTNRDSRAVMYVRGARAMGIPSRIDLVTGKTQLLGADGAWIDVDFEASKDDTHLSPNGLVALDYHQAGRIDNPKYYSHFTLSKIDGGRPRLLNYDEEASWGADFERPFSLDEGLYVLTSGQRMADGGVLARMQFFDVTPLQPTKQVPLVVRQDSTSVQVIGNFNSEDTYFDLASGTEKSLLSTTGRGYYVLGLILPGHEPTNHALRDIAAVGSDLEAWGKSLVLLFADQDQYGRFDASHLPAMPSTAVMGIDTDGKIAAEITDNLKLTPTDRPIFIIADTFNRIVGVWQGYTIGLGSSLLDTIHQLKE